MISPLSAMDSDESRPCPASHGPREVAASHTVCSERVPDERSTSESLAEPARRSGCRTPTLASTTIGLPGSRRHGLLEKATS